ncbi:GntR family transcriptional regulator [Streptomyces sp. HU2014]|uniref:GntR family transcriptional regulator n=1 Tax=Streptomyces sp. HU2014 TaxID=2939414 RepID=UPI00200E90F7|nr:GntR family transcriptional regulator [Streptomyces sp. HU2014]UQI47885.1 GntR family transcriptional regulator [Streptomyces sp. HU2014]
MTAYYHSLADDLRRRIESGEYEVDEQLPSEARLAIHYRVSVPTIRVALDVLQAEGRVEKFHGRGNFVRRPRERIVYGSAGHAVGRRPAESPPLRVGVEVRTVSATDDLSALLQVHRGTLLTEFEYVSVLGTSVRGLARLYVPRKVAKLKGPVADPTPWGDEVRSLLAAAGVHVASTVERVASRLPNLEERKLFRSTAPVLSVERTSTDFSGRIVEGALLALPGDRAEAVFSTPSAHRGHGEDRVPANRNDEGSELRLLPWATPDDKPCFLSTGDGQGVMSRYADRVEASQVTFGAAILDDAERLIADPEASDIQLRIALKETADSLSDVMRVAASRGARLPSPHPADPEYENTEPGRAAPTPDMTDAPPTLRRIER